MKTLFTEGTNLFNIGNIFILDELVAHQVQFPDGANEEI
jgi:hypothetical protein